MSEVLTGQKAMEAHLIKTMKENNEDQKNIVNGMMQGRAVACSYADKTITFEFPIQPWQANRVGQFHGGMMCTAFDIAVGALVRFYARESFAPTLSLDVKYIRPVQIGQTLVINAKATATGKRITQVTAEATVLETGKLAATASSMFMSINTQKERNNE